MDDSNKSTRLTSSGEATYHVKGGIQPPVTVLVREVSTKGVKFVTTEVLPPDTALELMIKVSSGSDAVSAIGKVIWQGHSYSKFLLDTAVEFVNLDPKTESRLMNYILSAVENIRVDRMHVRCPMITDVRYSLFNDRANKKEGISGDIGVAGMKLFVRENIVKDTEMDITFDLPNGRGHIAVRGKLVWKGQTLNGITPVGVYFSGIDQREKQTILRFVNYTLLHNASA